MKIPIIDDFLNSITTYRLTLYYLIALVLAAILLSFFGLLPFNPLDIVLDSTVAVVSCFIGNYILSKFFGAVTNIESVFITALILVLIIPTKFPINLSFLLLASAFAMGSKYLVTIDKQHIFNPAAAAVGGIALLSAEHSATWWVGTSNMVPFVLVGGLLLVRKIEREHLVFTFLAAFLFFVLGASFVHNPSFSSLINALQISVLRSPLFFFAFVMLTEPITSPSKIKLQKYYSLLVAFLYSSPQLRLLGFALTPELALCVGNVFSYVVSPKYKFFLKLKEKIQISKDTFVFNFGKIPNFNFTPGQYMEWTFPHSKTDSRGNRRYFSIASSPSEELMIAVKFYEPSSSYKKALLDMGSDEKVIASSLSGDFVLPKNPAAPVVFIAGGVGIAPFRSIIQDIIEKKKQVDILLLFANRTKEDILFPNLLESAKEFGVRTIYALTDTESIPSDWNGERGRITAETIQRQIPDFKNRTFYISGPSPMVKSYEGLLSSMGIQGNRVIVDYFPGYAE